MTFKEIFKVIYCGIAVFIASFFVLKLRFWRQDSIYSFFGLVSKRADQELLIEFLKLLFGFSKFEEEPNI